MITTLFRTPVRPSISERWDGLRVSASRPATTARPSREPCDVVALAIHLFSLRLQCCCKRLDSRAAARLGIVFYDHWVTSEPIGDDLRCTGGLTPKNAFIAKQTE